MNDNLRRVPDDMSSDAEIASEENADFDLALIHQRRAALRAARRHHDIRESVFVINEGIHGNLGGIGNAEKYERASQAARKLIRSYLEETAEALKMLASSRSPAIGRAEKLDLFARASRCYGQTALMLSGAGSLMPWHLGVAAALNERGLLPQVIPGSSGGAFIAAMLGSRSDAERCALLSPEGLDVLFLRMDELIGATKESRKRDVPIVAAFPWRHVDLLTQDTLDALIAECIPDMTFEEAYSHSGLAINIPITASGVAGASRLLNAITTPHVFLREGVRASCAVPGFFPATQLAAKDY